MPHALRGRVAVQKGQTLILVALGLLLFLSFCAFAVDGSKLMVEKRDGSKLVVDVSRARARHSEAQPSTGNAVLARGRYNGAVLEAAVLQHAKNNPRMWYQDR